MTTTQATLRIIHTAIADNKHISSRYIPLDGRTLRGLERRRLIHMSLQTNHARDHRYLSHWYDISITALGQRELNQIHD